MIVDLLPYPSTYFIIIIIIIIRTATTMFYGVVISTRRSRPLMREADAYLKALYPKALYKAHMTSIIFDYFLLLLHCYYPPLASPSSSFIPSQVHSA